MAGGICHWGPLVALSIIITLFLAGLYCTLLWFPPWTSVASVIHVAVFISWLALIMNYFLKSIWLGPGYLPLGWRMGDKTAAEVLQVCAVCNGYKAPRAHHCSKCERCVMKMDHHCPWINNCVGHLNHRSFTLFLFFVPIGCTHTTVILICCCVQQFYLLSGSFYQRVMFQRNAVVSFTFYHLVIVFFCIGLSVGVTIAVGLLLYYQIKGIMTNQTAIEGWIVEKADRPRSEGIVFTYPYDLGWKVNIKQGQVPFARRSYSHYADGKQLKACLEEFAFGGHTVVITLKHDYIGDGMTWPVLEGCDQYTLTREQLEQKKLKRGRTVCYSIVKSYNGSLIAWREGLKTCLCTPWTDEPRIKLQTGELVGVTRWRKYWLYGEKSQLATVSEVADGPLLKEKGWFPRHCAVRTEEEEDSHFKKNM